MSYDTRYTLASSDGIDHRADVAAASKFFNGCGWPEEACSWYDHDKDMRAYSRAHPGVVFVLDGDGEEVGDVWRKWYRGGQVREWKLPKLERPMSPLQPFDEEAL